MLDVASCCNCNHMPQAKRKGTTYQPSVKKEMRWGYWTQMKAEEALSHLKNVVFPGLVELADVKSSFGEYMKGAQCKINKAGLLIEACNLIDQMKIAEQNQDVQGDLSPVPFPNGKGCLLAGINTSRELQVKGGEELSALMASVLDRAFKGEL